MCSAARAVSVREARDGVRLARAGARDESHVEQLPLAVAFEPTPLRTAATGLVCSGHRVR